MFDGRLQAGFAFAEAFIRRVQGVQAPFGFPRSSLRVADLLFETLSSRRIRRRSIPILLGILRVRLRRRLRAVNVLAVTPIEPEEERPQGVLRFDGVVSGSQLERGDGELFVPLHDEDHWDRQLTPDHLFEDRKGIHTGMVVLDQENVDGEGLSSCGGLRGNRLEVTVRARDSFGNLDGAPSAVETLSRECRVSHIQQAQRP